MRLRNLLITGLVLSMFASNSSNANTNKNIPFGKADNGNKTANFSSSYYYLTLNSLADLKKLKPSYDGQVVTVTYKLISTDNCGGQFEWDAYSTSTPDDALVVQSSLVSTGRWKRVITNRKYYARWWSPVSNGADQSALLNKMLGSLPASSTIEFDANKVYNIASQVKLYFPVTVLGNNTTLVYKGATTSILSIRSSYVTVTALNVTGDLADFVTEGFGIAVEKTTNDKFYTNIIIQNCIVKNYKHVGIWLRYAKNFKVLNNTVTNIAYGGIIVTSCVNGIISNNKVSQITARYTPNKNAYGIQVLRGRLGDSVSNNILVSQNTVTGCPWEGIDTHGARDLIFSDNKVYNCNTGIAIVSIGNTGDYQAPKNIVVKNNYVENLNKPTGSAIIYQGVSASDPATGLISFNKCKGSAIKISRTRGVIITNNTIEQPSENAGIALKEMNALASVISNVIIDVWDPISDNTAAIKYMLGSNDAYIDGNSLVNGTFIPPSGSKNMFGFRPNIVDATNRAIFGKNNFSVAKSAQYANAIGSTFDVNAGAIRTIADASYSVGTGVKYVIFSLLKSTHTLTLPSASSNANRILYIRHAATDSIAVSFSTAVRKAGTTSTIKSLTFKNQCSLVSDGTSWWTMTQNF